MRNWDLGGSGVDLGLRHGAQATVTRLKKQVYKQSWRTNVDETEDKIQTIKMLLWPSYSER